MGNFSKLEWVSSPNEKDKYIYIEVTEYLDIIKKITQIKMNLIVILITLFILIIYISNLILNQKKKANYQKAGKKWDGIVKELSNRK